MSTHLTRRQQAIYNHLVKHQEQFDYPPSLTELCSALGLKSRGSLHKHIQALVEAGLVEPMGGQQRGIRLSKRGRSGTGELPLLGYIAAGRPIEAVSTPETVEVPSFLRTNNACYVLRVKGDSMIDDGIFDGDWVIIEHASRADNGNIVVALIDGLEATLKRIEQKPNAVVLHPANSTLQAKSYEPARITIQGVLVGQMRRY